MLNLKLKELEQEKSKLQSLIFDSNLGNNDLYYKSVISELSKQINNI